MPRSSEKSLGREISVLCFVSSRTDDGPVFMQEIGFSERQLQPHNESLSGNPFLTLSL